MDRDVSFLVLLVHTWDLAGLIISSPFPQLRRSNLPGWLVRALSGLRGGIKDGFSHEDSCREVKPYTG